jgi:antirestriction protein ArdC
MINPDVAIRKVKNGVKVTYTEKKVIHPDRQCKQEQSNSRFLKTVFPFNSDKINQLAKKQTGKKKESAHPDNDNKGRDHLFIPHLLNNPTNIFNYNLNLTLF